MFVAGEATTGFVGRHRADLVVCDPAVRQLADALGAWLLVETAVPTPAVPRRALAHRLPLSLRFAVDGREQAAIVAQVAADAFVVVLNGREHRMEPLTREGTLIRFRVDGVVESAVVDRDGDTLWLRYAGEVLKLEDRSRHPVARASQSTDDGRVRASMNGRVVSILAAVGDRVQPEQSLVTLEAMKMEHVHAAATAGVVRAILVGMGDQVEAHRVLMEIAPEVAGERPAP